MVGNITKWSYLEPLIFKEEWIHLSEISQKLGKNHSVVRQYLNSFEEEGILKKQKKGRMSMYKINLENPLIIDIFVLVEKEKLINRKKDLIIKEVIRFLHRDLPKGMDILIFGSSAENSKKANDVDILIIGEIDNARSKFKELEKKINKKIHLINVKSFEDINKTLKEELKKRHLIVQNSEKIIKWLI